MNRDNIVIKYFDALNRRTTLPQAAVKSEVFHYDTNKNLVKIEYYHIEPKPKPLDS